jgi:hypothetical protein
LLAWNRVFDHDTPHVLLFFVVRQASPPPIPATVGAIPFGAENSDAWWKRSPGELTN